MRLLVIFLCAMVFLSGCGGGGGGGDNSGCSGQCADASNQLTVADVKQILAQGIAQADAMGAQATMAVVDRVGNVLAVYRMAPGGIAVEISTTFPTSISGGLEGIVLPTDGNGITGADTLPAIAKAVTGAYLSSEGNAFTTRTASQIVQEQFNPGEQDQPGGPLFGVQFSQLACSDFMQRSPQPGTSVGPHRSPLGLSADPGGFPLYKGGTVVGGVGVIADGRYSIDKNILDVDRDLDEMIALAATNGFTAPEERRADRITLDGKTARFSDVDFGDLAVSPAQAPDFDSLQSKGALLDVPGYGGGAVVAGTIFGRPASGIRPARGYPGSLDAFTFVDQDNVERFPPTAGGDGAALTTSPLSASEVKTLLSSALAVANRARAQIRTPLGTPARVTISVVDTQGKILGMLRGRDAPVFGADVSLQKARSAALFSSPDAADFLSGIMEPAKYFDENLKPSGVEILIGSYVDAVQAFVGSSALTDGIAYTDRAVGNLARPFYPDGIRRNANGPFSKSFAANEWSVFSTGLQLDLAYNQILAHIFSVATAVDGNIVEIEQNCAQSDQPRIANGIQIFPGSVPIYRGDVLVGGIGVSGDGVDQDDMVAFLGLDEAGAALNGAINNAPSSIRADRLKPAGERLRYVQCPQTPYLDSSEQQVCSGK